MALLWRDSFKLHKFMSQVYLENGGTKNQFWLGINKDKKIRKMLFLCFFTLLVMKR